MEMLASPNDPSCKTNSPKACSCQSPYRSVHTTIIFSPIGQIFMEQPPHVNRIDRELDGQTKLSVHRLLWRETYSQYYQVRGHSMEWRKWDKAGSAGLYFRVWSKKASLVVTLRQWREGTEGASAPCGQWGKEYSRQRERKRLWRAGFGWAQEGRAGVRRCKALEPTVRSCDLNSWWTGKPLECSE